MFETQPEDFDRAVVMLQNCSTMKSATVRDLRNHYSKLLEWVCAGEEIVILRRGKAIARLIPENSASDEKVDWAQSAAVNRDRSREGIMTATESENLIRDAGGKW